ncbi:cytidine deaminase [Candidatus Saccharibacteria bacterium]|nr:cytidine deaminase [Candidatus Saccharibacteria bacterium]
MTNSPTHNDEDIWTQMYEAAKKEYHPEDVSPFIQAHHVVAAVQSAKTGKIYTGFCIEGASGVMNLCAERVAALNMYINEGNLTVRRMIAFRDKAPAVNGGMPCGACREFFMQAAYENRNMEILTDFETKKTVLLKDLVPNWWGDKRYK